MTRPRKSLRNKNLLINLWDSIICRENVRNPMILKIREGGGGVINWIILGFRNGKQSALFSAVTCGGGTRLAAKPLVNLGIAFDILRKELESDQTAKASVLGLIHRAHSAAAQFLDDALVRDGRADRHPRTLGRYRMKVKAIHHAACDSCTVKQQLREWVPSEWKSASSSEGTASHARRVPHHRAAGNVRH